MVGGLLACVQDVVYTTSARPHPCCETAQFQFHTDMSSRGYMRAAGTTRLIVVSSTSVYPPRRQQASLMLRLAEPIITRTIGKTVYDDMRRMEEIVSNSGLDWTVVRPSGLFDLPEPTKYVRGPIDPLGAFTARIDLAHYLISLVADSASIGRYVIVSTTEGTPTVWQMIRREAVSANASKPESARPASA
jgi:nucleoside-diphosphate-sugar epimerase